MLNHTQNPSNNVQFKIKYKHQSIFVYQPYWLSNVLYRLIPNCLTEKNIRTHWRYMDSYFVKNILIDCSDSLKHLHLNKPIRFRTLYDRHLFIGCEKNKRIWSWFFGYDSLNTLTKGIHFLVLIINRSKPM
jgi:hypothetical protein